MKPICSTSYFQDQITNSHYQKQGTSIPIICRCYQETLLTTTFSTRLLQRLVTFNIEAGFVSNSAQFFFHFQSHNFLEYCHRIRCQNTLSEYKSFTFTEMILLYCNIPNSPRHILFPVKNHRITIQKQTGRSIGLNKN